MFKLIFSIVVTTHMVLVLATNSYSFSLWKSCLKVDESFRYSIVDPDIIDMGNSQYWSMVIVSCKGVKRKCAFSNSCNNDNVFPSRSIVFTRNIKKICEGDKITVRGAECTLGEIKKEKW